MGGTETPESRAALPVGVFDSGVGGLSVLRDIRALLPHESLTYVADAGCVPYGGRPAAMIRERSEALVRFFRELPVKAVVVACNTATAAAAPALRARWPELPIIAMEPAVKPAVAVSRTGIIGVLATEGTLASDRFSGLVSQYAGSVRVLTQPCPGLVERVEQGDTESPLLDRLLRSYLQPLLDAGVDTLILGCTHYPFLRHRIQALAGPALHLIETGPAVARQLQRRLDRAGLLAPAAADRNIAFFTTGEPEALQTFLQRQWPEATGAVGRLDFSNEQAQQ
ncbi:glutamate racemase [Methylonatrum kenyense]|uniref:glutamate racemase n=1 Tax=Methylonatrum kenyense TaxID=455253 RepID=UPI0020BE0BFA|nr:glutamate racemase [Methylonatrum kenyense]MCK8516164.1 glutamate racemase [Methylonatrum kenyense]